MFCTHTIGAMLWDSVTCCLVVLLMPRCRISQLARQIAGVGQKMLTQTRRTLERDGLISRTVTPTVPVTVGYELTELGRSLHDAVAVLKSWAEANMDNILTNRATCVQTE